jgi:hypothetical protein
MAALLLAWNGLTAMFASPFTLTQWYDGAQYQLLARNRLHGHDDVGDTAHTVRLEGRHPMWRPGLVWIEQGLAGWVGSLRHGAALASALGTALLELALLLLAWRSFGQATCVAVLFCLLAPWSVAASFLGMAVGQGPEPWAAAAIVLGLAGLTEALGRESWAWATLAGAAAGMAEWFRTGTLVLFAVPCLVHGLVSLWQRDGRRLGLAGAALAGQLLMAFLAGGVVPSTVDKTVANLGHNLAENEGPFLTENVPEVGWVTFSMGGYRIVPGTVETYNDYIVRQAHGVSGKDFVAERARVLWAVYGDRLREVVEGRARGLRWMVGELVLAGFLFQVVASLTLRDATARIALPIAAGALAYYFGPVVLLRGDTPTHYLLLALPLFLVVAARGAMSLASLGTCFRGSQVAGESDVQASHENMATRDSLRGRRGWFRERRGWILVFLLASLACLSAHFYGTILSMLRDYQRRAAAEQAAVDALPLTGRVVACRNMNWFVDREVATILLPYATAADLERYVRAHRIDGVLVWDNETQVYFRATPYGSLTDFDRALRESPVFGPPQVSGAWRWYPVQRSPQSRRQP